VNVFRDLKEAIWDPVPDFVRWPALAFLAGLAIFPSHHRQTATTPTVAAKSSPPMTNCDRALACVDECKGYANGKGHDCVYDKNGSEPWSMVEAECTRLLQSTLLYCAQTCVQKYGKC
jgi:hypothetical protein